jgi:hypothetical protein
MSRVDVFIQGSSAMMRRLICVGFLVPAFGILLAGHASAGFTGASASGPGGTVSSLAIETTFTTDDSIQFSAIYTANAPIDFFLTLNGTGNYFIGAPFGNVTNNTSSIFPSFYAVLVSAPAGTTFNESTWENGTFSNGTSLTPPFPNATTTTFNGPPGITPGSTTDLGVGFSISASGPQTVEVVLTPVAAASVPEPSTFTLGLIGAIAIGYCARRFRRAG